MTALSKVKEFPQDSDLHPGEYLNTRILIPNGISQTAAAQMLGVSRQTLNQLVRKKRPISQELAMRISEHFGRTATFYLQLQQNYDQRHGLAGSKKEVPEDFTRKVEREWAVRGFRPLVDHEMRDGHKAGILGIDNFSIESVQPVSYDIRLGEQAMVSEGMQGSEINLKEQDLVIAPNETAMVVSFEEFRLPPFLFGKLGAISDLTSEGILTLHGHQVDPGFSGRLYVRLNNVGKRPVALEFGQPFISVVIWHLSVPPERGYEGDNIDRGEFSSSEQDATIPELQKGLDLLSSLSQRELKTLIKMARAIQDIDE